MLAAGLITIRHYGLALLLIIPLALTMTQILYLEPTRALMVDRAIQTPHRMSVSRSRSSV